MSCLFRWKWVTAVLACIAATALPATAAAFNVCWTANGYTYCILPVASSYYIDEPSSYASGTGNCFNVSTNDLTSHLESTLSNAGWVGGRYLHGHAWPADYTDEIVDPLGLDHWYGDTARWSIFAGHGNVGWAQFSRAHDSTCSLTWAADARLGEDGGADAGIVGLISSCTLNSVGRANFNVHSSRQFLGFHNSPSVGDRFSESFFVSTFGRSNKNSWLDEMEDRPGWGTGDNSPTVRTYGTDSTDSMQTVTQASLWHAIRVTPTSHTHVRTYTRNNGATCACVGYCN